MSVWLVGQRARPASVVGCRPAPLFPVTGMQPWPAHPAQDGTELGAGAIVSRGRSSSPEKWSSWNGGLRLTRRDGMGVDGNLAPRVKPKLILPRAA